MKETYRLFKAKDDESTFLRQTLLPFDLLAIGLTPVGETIVDFDRDSEDANKLLILRGEFAKKINSTPLLTIFDAEDTTTIDACSETIGTIRQIVSENKIDMVLVDASLVGNPTPLSLCVLCGWNPFQT